MIKNLSIAFHPFATRILISLRVDEMLPPRFANWPINFRSLPFWVEMTLFSPKHIILIDQDN